LRKAACALITCPPPRSTPKKKVEKKIEKKKCSREAAKKRGGIFAASPQGKKEKFKRFWWAGLFNPLKSLFLRLSKKSFQQSLLLLSIPLFIGFPASFRSFFPNPFVLRFFRGFWRAFLWVFFCFVF